MLLTRGEGVKNPKNLADVICERPQNETATHLGAAEILSSENQGKRIGIIESAKDIREATSLKCSNPREEVDMATWQQQIPEVTEALQKQ